MGTVRIQVGCLDLWSMNSLLLVPNATQSVAFNVNFSEVDLFTRCWYPISVRNRPTKWSWFANLLVLGKLWPTSSKSLLLHDSIRCLVVALSVAYRRRIGCRIDVFRHRSNSRLFADLDRAFLRRARLLCSLHYLEHVMSHRNAIDQLVSYFEESRVSRWQ